MSILFFPLARRSPKGEDGSAYSANSVVNLFFGLWDASEMVLQRLGSL